MVVFWPSGTEKVGMHLRSARVAPAQKNPRSHAVEYLQERPAETTFWHTGVDPPKEGAQ